MTLKPWHWIAIILVTVALVVMAPSDDTDVRRKGPGSAQSNSKVSDVDIRQESVPCGGPGGIGIAVQVKNATAGKRESERRF